MDLVWRETCRSVKVDIVSVHRSTVGNRPDARMSPRLRQILFSDKFQKLSVGRDNIVHYRVVYIRGYSPGLVPGNLRGNLVDWLVEFALVRCGNNLGFKLGHDLLYDVARLDDLLLSSIFEIRDCLIEDSTKLR